VNNGLMKVKFWGVRGSLPLAADVSKLRDHMGSVLSLFLARGDLSAAGVKRFLAECPLPQLVGYGQNTTCVEVVQGKQNLIIDGGSGIKTYNDFLATTQREKTIHHILLTHFHYDHMMGLTFFTPHFLKDHEIHYYCVQPGLQELLRDLFRRPFFPVNFESLRANVTIHPLEPYKTFQLEGFQVTPFKLDHSDPCYGFRVERNGKIYAHAVDHESERITRDELGVDAGLFEDADLAYFDAQYLELEMAERKGWGHGTFSRAFETCSLYRIKQIILAHHDPSYGTQDMERLVEQAKVEFDRSKELKKISSLKWNFAYDGQVIDLD
jgi:phosphoribosyl 1,2-cyclic phosphodiesterase